MPYVTDTHALIWHLTDDPRLSPEAKKIFAEVDDGKDDLFIPCIVFLELLYLVEKGKIAHEFGDLAAAASSRNYRVEPMCLPIIEKTRTVPRERVPDPWDRLIAATSLHLEMPLISRDRSLAELGLEVIW